MKYRFKIKEYRLRVQKRFMLIFWFTEAEFEFDKIDDVLDTMNYYRKENENKEQPPRAVHL